MEKVVFLDRETIAPQIKLRRPRFEHEWVEFDRSEEAQVFERIKDATIVINNKVPIRRDLIEQLTSLRLIAMAATGYDCVNTEACRDAGVTVANIRGYAVNSVPEHTFALILSLRRNLFAYRQDVNDGEWEKADQFCFFHHPIHDLGGSNLVIIGAGSIGQSVAVLGQAFGMNVHFAARKGGSNQGSRYTPWEKALRLADIISIHCPLTPETEGLIRMREFERMDRKPILINTSRGRLVVEAELEVAMQRGLIAGAGFDVAEIEPVSPHSPLMRLMARPNFILTPHIAWASEQAQQTLADQMIDNIENFIKGIPTNVVV